MVKIAVFRDNRGMRNLSNLLLFSVFILANTRCTDVANAIEACGGLTLSEVKQQNSISSDCRQAVQSLLSDASSSFSSKILVLGGSIVSSQPTIYVVGVDGNGNALSASTLLSSTVKVTQGGTESTLSASEFTTTDISSSSDSIASISVVTDYSASMEDTDLDDMATIYTDIFNALPTIYEAEVIHFTGTVTQKLSFSTDKTTILTNVARDDSIERGSTALYDGMGTALANLTARSRPVRILITATDGLENASDTHTKDSVTSSISTNKIFTIMIGALFSDVDELTDLAGSNGVYFYAKSYTAMKSNVTQLVASLQNIVKVQASTTYSSATSMRVDVSGLTGSFSF